MEISVNPKDYGLNSRVVLSLINADTIAIVKKRNSRIIMKDAKQLLNQINLIKSVNADLNVSLIVSGPVCSKTTFFLAENNIKIVTE